jgi:hypothetical protein
LEWTGKKDTIALVKSETDKQEFEILGISSDIKRKLWINAIKTNWSSVFPR